ncbi:MULTISPECIES: hypothetical protein [unclassified Streptomyces]|uniref:Uncharacterized protein n=1 Tax=Streptomyces sp. NBC_00119 TaxID=2975659 RepID=A0AAU1U0L1_9ACTN|nr:MULTISPECIES: hypothetical protein [unclassified Streptomyces]MCX4648270.1 hypothetical protein [Streptomyces sp. NBC_01446]MCX5323612.1 hypothetical protein [Streptomyces sp. NBC_00120]
MQRANANAARLQVLTPRDDYGPTIATPWTEAQTETYETAWRAWRDLARDVQAAVTEHAKVQGAQRHEIESDVKAKAKADSGEQ